MAGPFAPHDLAGITQVHFVFFLDVHREHQRPVGIGFHRLHEAVGDQQGKIELAQASILALGADELFHVRVRDIERAHLRAAPAAGRRYGETHLVVDVHERQRARGVGARAGHVGVARAQRREFVADAATGLQRESGLVDFFEDVVHRIGDGAGYCAVDGGRGRLVLARSGVGGDAPGRDRAMAQRPQETFVPLLAQFGRGFDVGQRARDPRPGVVHGRVDRFALLGLEAVFLVPDVQ